LLKIAPTATPTPDPLAPKNVLLLGYGGGTHEGGLLTDTMMVAHIDPKLRTVSLISIPRDLWVSLPLLPQGSIQEKINTAYAYGFDTKQYTDRPSQYSGDDGGANLAKYAATLVTGLHMDAYVAVSFEGFKSVVNTLGPVTVNVPYAFEDTFYPIEGKEKDTCEKSPEDIEAATATLSGELLEHEFPCRFETVKFDKGEQIMEASPALQFVRSRHSLTYPGDFYRSMRQQALIAGVIAKLKTLGGIVKIPSLISQINKFIATDITPSYVLELMQRYGNPLDFHITRIPLTEDNVLISSQSAKGQYILVPKMGNGFDSVKQYIDVQVATSSASTSATR
jgi:anionic cell wall polymer biosynthesis LytR-Cps2A-Psr (LCP) family protein